MGEVISKIGEYVSSITDRECKILIFGILLGAFIMYFIRNTYSLKKIKSNPAESILVVSITGVVFFQIFNPELIRNMANPILSFISTMAFSWLMTKYSVRNDYENKQKEMSALSYKHSTGIKNKIEFTLNEVDNYINEIDKCDSKSNCNLKNKFENIKSQIKYSHQDAIDNLNDWAVNISEEIELYNESIKLGRLIEEKEDEINYKISKKEDTYSTKSELKKFKKEKKECINSINSKVLHLIKSSKEDSKINDTSMIKSRISNKLNKKNTNINTSEAIG